MKFIDSEMMERYLRGESDAEESHKVLMWLMINLRSSSADSEFKELLEKVPVSENAVRKQRVKSRLGSLMEEDRRYVMKERRRKVVKVLYGIALSVACLACVVTALFAVDLKNDMAEIVSWTEVTTSYGEKKEVVLPDGSHIWLHNDSRINYPASFKGGLRQVFVSGEVFADIVKDEEHPFVVSCDSVNVVVRGTTFNFRAYPDKDNVELTLLEGVVELDYLTSQGKQNVGIVPGETISVNLSNGNVNKYISGTEDYVSWKDRRALYFNDETLSDIVAELQREFGVRIIIKDKALAKTRHFASFVNDESPVEILQALCSESGIEVEQKDSILYIYNH